jgi:protoheme IX farnesyltransferase
VAFNRVFKEYYQLAKPGIIYGNLLTAVAGFLFASHFHNDWTLLIYTCIGLGLIIGSGCVINNVIDKELDISMERTKKRAIVTGKISVRTALVYGILLGLIGALVLLIFTNNLTVLVALFGLLSYLAFYGYAKRKTIYGTLVGSIAGAVPPLVGYCAITGYIDLAGMLIVMMMVCWQLSHFYAISLYRKSDYAAAKLPVWPVVKGDDSTKLQILGFMIIYILFGLSLFIFGYCGFLYLLIILGSGLWWFIAAKKSLRKLPTKTWGKKVFLNSLIIITIMSVALAIGPIAP